MILAFLFYILNWWDYASPLSIFNREQKETRNRGDVAGSMMELVERIINIEEERNVNFDLLVKVPSFFH